jgi:hypothetical protein
VAWASGGLWTFSSSSMASSGRLMALNGSRFGLVLMIQIDFYYHFLFFTYHHDLKVLHVFV